MMRLGRRAGLVLANTLVLGSVVPVRAHSQPAAVPPTAALLKRLAEAVDGHRTGAMVYLVAARRPPHDVVGIYELESEARARAGADTTALQSFGPFQTDRDPGLNMGFLSKCVHLQSAMHEYYCPGSPIFSFTDVENIALTIRMRDGTPHVIPVPKGADAIFLTLSAVDKFAIPYYARVSGLGEAVRLRARLVDSLTRRP